MSYLAQVPRNLVQALVRVVARTRRSLEVQIAVGMVGAQALRKAGLLEEAPSRRGALEIAYLILWWIGFLLLLTIPSYPQDPAFYFSAILALAAAWLLTMPLYGHNVLTTDFRILSPPKGVWALFIGAIQKRRVDIPPVLLSPEAEAEMDALLPTTVPAIMPAVLTRILVTVGIRAIYVALLGLAGLLVGPQLSQIHWWWNWSPVAVLYALSAPWTALLLISMVLPLVTQAFMAGLSADAAFEVVKDRNKPSKPDSTRTPRRRTKPNTGSSKSSL
jgi:hypothetical protein